MRVIVGRLSDNYKITEGFRKCKIEDTGRFARIF
jgi:hypothetical protein